jgi:hypothetical protein
MGQKESYMRTIFYFFIILPVEGHTTVSRPPPLKMLKTVLNRELLLGDVKYWG